MTEKANAVPARQIVAKPVTVRVVTGSAPVENRGTTWQAVAPSRTSSALRIAWTQSPYPGCGQVQTLYLSESSTQVVISLATAHTSGEGGACPAVGQQVATTVHLAAPPGSRQLIETHEN